MRVVEWIPHKERWGWRDGSLVIVEEWVYLATPSEVREHHITWKNIPLIGENLYSVFPRSSSSLEIYRP